MGYSNSQKMLKKIWLILNEKKSGLMWIHQPRSRKHVKIPNEMEGIPRVIEYKYLGITLEEKYGLRRHLENIKKRYAHITSRLDRYTARMSVEHRRVLWNALFRPHFEYVSVLIPNCCKTEQERGLENTFKRALQLSISFPKAYLQYILCDPLQWAKAKSNQKPVKLNQIFNSSNIIRIYEGSNKLILN
jgi:hypothetical protein